MKQPTLYLKYMRYGIHDDFMSTLIADNADDTFSYLSTYSPFFILSFILLHPFYYLPPPLPTPCTQISTTSFLLLTFLLRMTSRLRRLSYCLIRLSNYPPLTILSYLSPPTFSLCLCSTSPTKV